MIGELVCLLIPVVEWVAGWLVDAGLVPIVVGWLVGGLVCLLADGFVGWWIGFFLVFFLW